MSKRIGLPRAGHQIRKPYLGCGFNPEWTKWGVSPNEKKLGSRTNGERTAGTSSDISIVYLMCTSDEIFDIPIILIIPCQKWNQWLSDKKYEHLFLFLHADVFPFCLKQHTKEVPFLLRPACVVSVVGTILRRTQILRVLYVINIQLAFAVN